MDAARANADQPVPRNTQSQSGVRVSRLPRRRCFEWKEYGIRANTVSPGAVLTERVKSRMPPANVESNDDVKFTSVDQLANAIVCLLSDLASGISGQTLVVDSALSTKFCGGGRKTAAAR
jgi:NAD(P)-dependent dehydrogenase (short-subunit alcohol dehydrogenase family)